MTRLFDRTDRLPFPLYWLGTRPVDDVRAAERRATAAARSAAPQAGRLRRARRPAPLKPAYT